MLWNVERDYRGVIQDLLKKMKKFLSFLLCLILISCGTEPTIDGSSDQAFQKSIEKVSEQLPDEKRKQLLQSLMRIAIGSFDLHSLMNTNLNDGNPAQLAIRVRKKLDGKTAGQVIKMASDIENKRQQSDRVQALEKIKELEQKKEKGREDAKKLQKIKISDVSIFRYNEDITSYPYVKFTVHNGTEYAIIWIHFTVTHQNPKRQVPYFEIDGSHKISGGMEPDETKTVEAVLLDGDFKKLRDNTETEIEVYKIQGPNDEVLLSSKRLDEYEEILLEKYKENYLKN